MLLDDLRGKVKQFQGEVYKWVLANLMLEVTLRWASIPSRGSRNTLRRFMLWKPEISASLMGHLACVQTLPTFTYRILVPSTLSVKKLLLSQSKIIKTST